MVEQCVASRKHEAVEVAVGGEAQQDAPVVDAHAERLDRSRVTQLDQRAVSAVHRFAIALLDEIALPAPIDVVDQHDVDSVRPEPLQAVLERAHRAVVAVVERDLERSASVMNPRRDAPGNRLQQPSDFG